jgi:hypothetical protein
MMLEEKLDKLKDTWCSIERADGKFIVSAQFPENYNVYDSEDNRIKVVDDRKNSKRFWYIASDSTVSLIEVIDFIEATVNANIEAIKRAMLYETKMKELQELFNNDKMSYDDLEALSFGVKQRTNLVVENRPILKVNKSKKNSEKEEKKVTSSYSSNEKAETKVVEDGDANKVVSKDEDKGKVVDGVDVEALRG